MNDDSYIDSTPVVFRKIKQKVFKPKTKEAAKFIKLDNNEIIKPNKIHKDTSHILQQGRLAKKLSQKQLSQQLHMPMRIIKDIESGKAPRNKALFQRLARYLGVKI